MEQLTAFEVGKPFPHPLTDNAAWWDIHDSLIVFSAPELSSRAADGLQVDRVWLTAHNKLLGLTFTFTGRKDALEVVGMRVDPTMVGGSSGMPTWVAAAGEGGHLFLTFVWVDDDTKTIVRVNSFTLSAHMTATLRQRAEVAWDRELSRSEAVEAIQDWQARFPNAQSTRQAAIASCRPGS